VALGFGRRPQIGLVCIDDRSAVNDIDLPDGSDTLYAATYGRSVWTTALADAG
jgi:hypothetical protein